MRRNVSELVDREFDLLIVGGGIFGICAAWDATLRGLSVALVEAGDFGHATSANCFKMVHGGIRYLQHGDVIRVRESSMERTALLQVAPHLVSPLPIVVPTYGRGLRSREALQTAMALYQMMTFDRNWGIKDADRQIPPASAVSRTECLEMAPGLEADGLTGGVLFFDGQMYSPPRLALAFLKSAVAAGAAAANYVKATGFLKKDDRVIGIAAQDVLSGDSLEVRAKIVINAAGPWAEGLLQQDSSLGAGLGLTFSRDAAIVVNRPLIPKAAVAVQGSTRDPDAVMSRGNRHLFMVPWRDSTLIGVWHVVYQGDPNAVVVTPDDVEGFLTEFNNAYALDNPLTLDDVSLYHAGLVLFGQNQVGGKNLSYGKRSLIMDHESEGGMKGLVTVVGVRYTTARGVGEKAINLVFKKLGRKSPRCKTASTPIYGGDIEGFDGFLRQVIHERPESVPVDAMDGLARNHGSAYKEIFGHIDHNPTLGELVGVSNVIKAEVIHAVRHEMAQKLGDVVLRRTDLGTGGHPGEDALTTCANLMGAELGWGRERERKELEEVRAVFPRL